MPDLVWAVLLILLAPAVGSFLGVLVDRSPEGRGVVLAQSSCASCGARLRWRDMAPVLSFLTLKGRCRDCGAAIPGHLLRIEIAALLAALLAVALIPEPVPMALAALFLWLLIALFYSDLLHFRLPNPLTLALLIAGLILATLDPSRGLTNGLLSAAIAFGAFWGIRLAYQAVRHREGLGLGDVKLMAGIGAALGWQAVPYVALLAGLLALLVTALESTRTRTTPKATQKLPFGSYLSAAAAAVFLAEPIGLAL